MRAGPLRHRLLIEEAQETQDISGDPVVTWTETAQVYGAIEPSSGSEGLVDGGIKAESDTLIRIRYGPTVTPKHRIRHQGTVYNVVDVANVMGRNRELHIFAKTGVNDG